MSWRDRVFHPFSLAGDTQVGGEVGALTAGQRTQELGDTGMGYWGYVHPGTARRIRDLEYLHDLQGMRAYPIYDRMRLSDPKVAGLRYATDLPLLKADVRIESADPKSDAANKVKEAVEQALFDMMAYSWRSMLSEILLYRDYGFAPFEIIWTLEDGKYGIDRLAYRPPSTVWWIWGANGRIDRIEQSVFGHWLTMQGEKLCWFVNKREGENWRGRSVLRPMHKAWYQKERLETLLMILTERGGGIPIFKEGATVAGDKKLQNKIEEIIRRFRIGESMGLRLPPDVEFELAESKANIKDIVQEIEYYDMQMSNTLLAQVLDLGKTATGSRALGLTMGDMLEEACEAEANIVEDVFNAREGLIWQFVEYNFGGDVSQVRPKLKFGRLGKIDPLVFGNGLQFLSQAGLTFDDPLTQEEIRSLLGLPQLNPDALDDQDAYLEKQRAKLTAPDPVPPEPPFNQTVIPQPDGAPKPGQPQTINAQVAATAKGVSQSTKADISKPASPIAAPILPTQTAPVLKTAESYRTAPTDKLARLESFCDLAEISATLDGTKDAIKAATATTREAQAAELAKRARVAASKGRAAGFVASRPPMVDALTKQIATVLTAHYQAGRQQVASELDRQRKGEPVGQEITDARHDDGSTQLSEPPEVPAAVSASIAQEAEIAARKIAAQAQAAAAQQAMRDAATPLDDDVFEEGIMRESDAAALRCGGQVTRLMNAGRADQAKAQSAEIADATYSAILDRNTCDTCESQDGDTTTDLDEAASWTPNPQCDGGDACRCLTVFELAQPGDQS